jgi:3-hydroxyacyl-[acyl-carrier-protein] dehydratase
MNFLLLDRIVSLEPGRAIVAQRRIGADEPYFPDHFPGFPVVPGVLLTEMMGQAAAKCLEADTSLHDTSTRGRPMLARIQDASFRGWVRPNDLLDLHATIVSSQGRVATAQCEARVGDRVVAQAKLMFGFAPLDAVTINPRDTVLRDYTEGKTP